MGVAGAVSGQAGGRGAEVALGLVYTVGKAVGILAVYH